MKPEEFEVYVIPPNFMEGGTLFGGLLKTRNTIEAVILGLAVGVPVLHLPFSLTVRVVILCLTALPLVLLALIGVSGMSLSAFIRLFFCFLHNRRILSRDGTQGGKNGKTLLPSWAQQRKSDCEAEDPPLPKSRSRFSVDLKQRSVTQFKTFLQEEEAVQPLNALADYIPTHGNYLCVDGLYYAYLLVPSDGYKARVPAGWLSLLVNAGDGIDLDVFLTRQPKDRMVRKLGQQLRINRSKIKETSDTNTDFDDLDGAIRSGYFLKDGLSNNEDFYYLNLLITVTAGSVDDLEWKVAEMKKLLLSQDMDVQTCSFCQEQAFLSSLPLVSLERQLYERSKRNVLTTGAASCYPFTSYEMCDDNGILLGVNKHNNSLIIVDIFDSRVYKNANIAILGTSGAGKTFTLQLMALRMRRKGIQVFIIAPLKGHEFHRACSNIGGQFISISPASQNCINIMEIRKADKSVDDLLDGPGAEKSLLAAKIQRLHTFFSLLIPDMSHEERQLLDDAMICTYGTKGITHDNASLEQPKNPGCYKEMPILGDLYEILAASPETKRLANILNRLVNGSARSFNQQTNVALDNKYIVLDISELTGDLLTVGMFVALDFVWDKAKENRTAEKAIFVDECWQLIGASSNRQAAESVLELAKTIRGYGGSLVCATQDLNDFFALDDGKYGKGIINNSKTKILLNLEEEEAQRVQGVLHLSEAELMEITHFERGSALISTNNNNIAVEIKCSQMEKELITTDRRELAELAQRAAPKQHPC